MRIIEICVSWKNLVDTQNKKKENLRVGKKFSGHAKQEKRKFACQGKNKQTRKTRKKEIYVSGKKLADTQNKKKGNLRVGEKFSRHAKQENREFACL